jgi:hypothetical protein
MSKKLTYSASLFLLLFLFSSCFAELVGWWKLDEGSDSLVSDAAGDNDGTINGATWIDDAIRGWCLQFDGDGDYVEIPHDDSLTLLSEGTVTAWVKLNGAVRQAIVAKQPGTNTGNYHLISGSDGTMLFGITNGSWSQKVQPPTPGQAITDEWAFYAGTFDASRVNLYENSVLVNGMDNTITTIATDQPVLIGRWPYSSDWDCDGRISDVRIYNHALSEADIEGVMQGVGPAPQLELAGAPSPADGAVDAPCRTVLSWTPGIYADTHDVYFGTVFDDVKNASRDNPLGVLVRQGQTANSYDAGLLEFGQTYYWRIDEVNAPPDPAIFKGPDVWEFTVEPIAHPIAAANITATASSSNSADEGPENTVNGSGLDANDLRSTEVTDMWLSNAGGPQPTWIQYEFDRVYKLHQMQVWNYNSLLELSIGFGIKSAAIEYSADGTSWDTFGTTREFARARGASGYPYNTTVDFDGVATKYVRITANSNWGDVVNQYGLSEVRFLYIPVRPREPEPVPGATGLAVDNMTVSWRAGREAASHKVYLSTSEQAVKDETVSPVSIPADGGYASYSVGTLDLGQTYYWKVNEVNDAETPRTWEGPVWNFRTAEYLAVDDMESYGEATTPGEPGSRVWYAWRDGFGWSEPAPGQAGNGTGSMIGNDDAPFVETQIVHSGRQSLPYTYNNTGANGKAFYSEAEHLFGASQNWTQYNIKALVLYFHGSAGNDANEQMYIKLEDSSGHSNKVFYDGDASDVSEATWHEWNIALQDFSGVDLTKISKMVVGFGDSIAPTRSGTGKVYFDDIRLYPSRCLPKYGPRGDITDDCTVDFGDILVLAGDWLQTDHGLEAVQPDPAWLVGWWKLDEGTGQTVMNSAGGSDGTIVDATRVEDAVRGWCLEFDGDGDYVGIEQDESLTLLSEGTVTAWVKLRGAERQAIVTKQLGTDTGNYYLITGSDGTMLFGITNGIWSQKVQPQTPGQAITNEWAFYAGTFDSSVASIYENAVLVKSVPNTITPLATEQPLMIGRWQFSDSWDCNGLISDVHVYNHALSQAEIASVMGLNELYFPITSRANLYNQEPKNSRSINFHDIAVLAEDWLAEHLWP